MENFFEDFYIQLEETRNKVSTYRHLEPDKIQSAQVTECHTSLDAIYRSVQAMQDAAPVTMDTDDIYVAMVKSCLVKAKHLCYDVLDILFGAKRTSNSQTVIDDGLECQQAIAQMVEISIRLSVETGETFGSGEKRNFEEYAEYQRAVLRQRSKPSIASLANLRKIAKAQSIPIVEYIQSTLENDNYNDRDNNVEKRPHAHAITFIFGEASSLIHPLLMWKDGISDILLLLKEQDEARESDNISRVNGFEAKVQSLLLEMCCTTTRVLHKEASNLGKTVGEWFLADNADAAAPIIDSNLDEMAFICQVLHRYEAFTKHLVNDAKLGDNSVLEQHLAEHIFLYSTAESQLLSRNVETAIELAQPVQIVMGTDRYVPSVVEDAYYISQRCLERASSTLSPKTIILTANSVVEIWGTEGGIHKALMEQKGCRVMRDVADEKDGTKEQAPSSGFNLFLSALEKDIDKSSPAKDKKRADPPSGNVDIHRVQMDVQICLLNGLVAASTACNSLSTLFDCLLPDDSDETFNSGQTSMLAVAKEQLQIYSKAYQEVLASQINEFLEEWIGKVVSTENAPPLIASLPHSPSIHRLFYLLSTQNYDLNSSSLKDAESEENMKLLISLFEESRLMVEIQNGKCEDQVALKLLQEVSRQVVQLFLSTLCNQKQRKFSEWGSLLLGKQIRRLEEYFCSYILKTNGNTSLILREFKKLAQAVTILQCTNPRDWVAMKGEVGDTEFDLSQGDIRLVMILRSDWSSDAIDVVCQLIR